MDSAEAELNDHPQTVIEGHALVHPCEIFGLPSSEQPKDLKLPNDLKSEFPGSQIASSKAEHGRSSAGRKRGRESPSLTRPPSGESPGYAMLHLRLLVYYHSRHWPP